MRRPHALLAAALALVMVAMVACASERDGALARPAGAEDGAGADADEPGADEPDGDAAPAPDDGPGDGPSPGADGLGDPYFPTLGNGGYDARHYDLALDWQPDEGRLD